MIGYLISSSLILVILELCDEFEKTIVIKSESLEKRWVESPDICSTLTRDCHVNRQIINLYRLEKQFNFETNSIETRCKYILYNKCLSRLFIDLFPPPVSLSTTKKKVSLWTNIFRNSVYYSNEILL